MSKFMMFAFSVGLTIGSIAFACLLKWYERSGWGWFLLMGFFFWSSALNVYEKRELAPTYAPQFDLLAEDEPGIGKKQSVAPRA